MADRKACAAVNCMARSGERGISSTRGGGGGGGGSGFSYTAMIGLEIAT